ncbi:MAG: flagellar hook-length control protein FliK [Proteobacteria bacterium]|nr:flagellar hook-length control protein FliK [Pseudomonadota bacterium]
MNIAQINQHQKSQPSNEVKPTELDINLSDAFKGQLQYAENDLKLMSPQITKGDELKDHHEEIEQKRQEEDIQKSVALSYWNDQNLENRYEASLEAKSQGQALQSQAAQEKAQAQAKTIENALNQKRTNLEIGNERIRELKPHVISSGLQEGGAELPKQDFSEMFRSKQQTETKPANQQANLASISDIPKDAEQLNQLANQAQNRLNRDGLQAKLMPEKNEGAKIQGIQESSQKPNTSVDYKANKSDTLAALKDGSKQTAKTDGFVNQLNTSVKEGQKTEAAATAKTIPAKEMEQQNPNVKDVTDNIKILLNSGRDTIVIRLNPEHLGKLEIKLKKAGETLTGEFKVDSVEAKKILSAEFAQLQQDLENQGIKLDQFTVFVKGEENSAYSQNSSQGQQQEFTSEQHAGRARSAQQEVDPVVHQAMNNANTESGVNIVI